MSRSRLCFSSGSNQKGQLRLHNTTGWHSWRSAHLIVYLERDDLFSEDEQMFDLEQLTVCSALLGIVGDS